ncbi:MAG: transcription termination/antitermination protein NusG [Bacillota bacterium]
MTHRCMEKQWYVIHTYSGYENKVKANLEKRVESMNMGDKIFRILVPVEDEIQVKDGKRKAVKRKVYPGYVMVEMKMTDDSWYVVRNTPGGYRFRGNRLQTRSPAGKARSIRFYGGWVWMSQEAKIDLEVGQHVRVASGPFENFIGSVDEIYPEKGKVKVLVSMFGRETPVELEFHQVEKI